MRMYKFAPIKGCELWLEGWPLNVGLDWLNERAPASKEECEKILAESNVRGKDMIEVVFLGYWAP